jgi:curved DNA-binding protein CbpA
MATTGPLRIKLRCASWQQLATIYRHDLSKGTLFLRATNAPPVGTPVRVDLALPSSTVIELEGVLAQHVADPQRGNGVTIELAPMAAGAIWMIESALAAERPKVEPPAATGAVPSLAEGADMASAETELSRALLAEAESLKKLNPFLVLGIGYEAGDAEVRQAFGELTKRYHPDRFARYESSELRRVAAEIFVLIRDAYRRLADEAGRAQVLASLGRPRDGAAPPRTGSGAWSDVRRPAVHIPALPKTVPLRTVTVPVATPAPTAPTAPADPADLAALEELIDEGRLDEALSGYRMLARRHPQERALRAGAELVEGLLALRLRDRMGAAQRFEAALEIDPSNERAACELADMRRQATDERKGLLARLMGRPEGT